MWRNFSSSTAQTGLDEFKLRYTPTAEWMWKLEMNLAIIAKQK